jgi:hypothetical protein
MNFITALVALALVLLGGYYVFYVITPSERDQVINQYVPETSGAKQVFDKGVENVNSLLNR